MTEIELEDVDFEQVIRSINDFVDTYEPSDIIELVEDCHFAVDVFRTIIEVDIGNINCNTYRIIRIVKHFDNELWLKFLKLIQDARKGQANS